jgi:hypothetical protein
MAGLQHLDIWQIKEVVAQAVERRVPAAVTFLTEDRWVHLHSRLLALRDDRLLIEQPAGEDGRCREVPLAARLGLSFKLRHHKHVFAATAAGQADCVLDDGDAVRAVALCRPTRMQRIQRRAYQRARVPPHCIVRASFWLGGCQAEPAGTTPDRPVCTGRVVNISAGGFQLHTADRHPEDLESGYLVGVRLAFGAGAESIYADAQIRHVRPESDGLAVGFQFLGLEHSPQGRRALRQITNHVVQYQLLAVGQAPRRPA